MKDETRRRLYKSRYGSVDMYLSEENDKFNDVDVIYRDEHLQILLDEGKVLLSLLKQILCQLNPQLLFLLTKAYVWTY